MATVASVTNLVKYLSNYCRVLTMDAPDGSPVLRIGEPSRRLGVSDDLLQAWESRYALLQPVRSAGASGCTPSRVRWKRGDDERRAARAAGLVACLRGWICPWSRAVRTNAPTFGMPAAVTLRA